MASLKDLAARVGSISDPSKRITQYHAALLHAAQMEMLHASIEDRELRQRSTRAVAVRRLGRLSPEDRARVGAVEGVIE